MPERPLILFAQPMLLDKDRQRGGGDKFFKPTYDRQVARVAPKFETLRTALVRGNVRITNTADAIEPEYTLVFETVGDPSGFSTAINTLKKSYPNVEWIMELADHCPNSDDFYVVDDNDVRNDNKELLTKIFCIVTNQEALSQILSLWNHYSSNPDYEFERGFAGFRHLFETLNDVHQWGIQERLHDTGLLEIWQDELENPVCENVSVQIELFFRSSVAKRTSAERRLRDIVALAGGSVTASSVIPEIGYHALLASIPRQYAQRIIDREEVELVLAEEIMFMKATGQAVYVGLQDAEEETLTISSPSRIVEEPVVALFDGMPQENHPLLSGLLIVDDPDGIGERYPVNERIHGTSMASLLMRGKNMDRIKEEVRKIYVRPILKSRRDFGGNVEEYFPDEFLMVDKIHECVRRLFEPSAGRVAPSIRVINLSIGISYREYYNLVSPLARLLDWLSYKYRVLFVVSAGNHVDSISLGMDYRAFGELPIEERDKVVARYIADNIRNLRVLSPAESMNALTVGAVFADDNAYNELPSMVLPQSSQVPAAYSSFGRGINNSIKPDILYDGGRNLVRFDPTGATFAKWRNSVTYGPGIKSAYPGNPLIGSVMTGYSCGTSNAAALISNQAANCYDILNGIFVSELGESIPQDYAAVLLKAMLAHGASWRTMENAFIETQNLSGNQAKNALHKYLGYGAADIDSVKECAQNQATLIGYGEIKHGQAYEYAVPLPFDFHSQKYHRRLTVTLAYFTPVRSTSIKYRETQVWFNLHDGKDLVGSRAEYDYHAVQRGSLQHEVFSTDKIFVWDESGSVHIKVNCRNDAAPESEEISIPYALFATFEIAPEYEIDVYQRVVDRVRIRETVTPNLD